MSWLFWGLLLLLQNASFTLVSRARNSGSLGWHAIAAIGSNGIWFISNAIIVAVVAGIIGSAGVKGLIDSGNWPKLVIAGLFYTICTVVGSVSMHYVAMRWIETGKRKVGA